MQCSHPRFLAKLAVERQRHLDTHGDPHIPFRRIVIPQTTPSPDVYRRLEDWGFDGTIAIAWPVSEYRYASLDSKLEAMPTFAGRYLNV